MNHATIEKNATLLLILSFLVVTIGGLVQIVPLFYLENTIENVEGMRPYSPLELAGRNVYIREGCYICHSQMIRPFRDEVERYGHFSLAAESMYDHPFQWGSKRTGPDLARVGGTLLRRLAPPAPDRSAQRGAGIGHAGLRLPSRQGSRRQGHRQAPRGAQPDGEQWPRRHVHRRPDRQCRGRYRGPGHRRRTPTAMLERYPKAQARDYDGQGKITEMDALIAYLQMLGTLVDTSTFKAAASR